MRPIAEDPVLAEAIRKSNVASIRHWAVANLERPGQRVPANLGPEIIAASRDLVRRGLDESALDTYRIAQGVVWRRWMEIAFDLTSEPQELRELLDVTALSIATFIEDTITAVTGTIQGERDDLTAGTHAERRATVALLLEGAPIRAGQAEAQLGYRLDRPSHRGHRVVHLGVRSRAARGRSRAARQRNHRAGQAHRRRERGRTVALAPDEIGS